MVTSTIALSGQSSSMVARRSFSRRQVLVDVLHSGESQERHGVVLPAVTPTQVGVGGFGCRAVEDRRPSAHDGMARGVGTAEVARPQFDVRGGGDASSIGSLLDAKHQHVAVQNEPDWRVDRAAVAAVRPQLNVAGRAEGGEGVVDAQMATLVRAREIIECAMKCTCPSVDACGCANQPLSGSPC